MSSREPSASQPAAWLRLPKAAWLCLVGLDAAALVTALATGSLTSALLALALALAIRWRGREALFEEYDERMRARRAKLGVPEGGLSLSSSRARGIWLDAIRRRRRPCGSRICSDGGGAAGPSRPCPIDRKPAGKES